jgi:hypothetical protein
MSATCTSLDGLATARSVGRIALDRVAAVEQHRQDQCRIGMTKLGRLAQRLLGLGVLDKVRCIHVAAVIWYYPVRQRSPLRCCRPGISATLKRSSCMRLNGRRTTAGRITGLSELYKARGNTDAARKFEEKLAKIWIGDRALLQFTKL